MDLKDSSYAIRVAYMAKLKPLLKYAGVVVPVYDSIVPDTAPNYFVVIKDQNEADDSNKCGFMSDVHVTLDVVTRFPPGSGTGTVRDNILGQINAIICSTDASKRLDLTPDFKVMNSVRTLTRPIDEPSTTGNILRKVVIFKHKVQQLT
jgi:hypothetical protein